MQVYSNINIYMDTIYTEMVPVRLRLFSFFAFIGVYINSQSDKFQIIDTA